MPTFIRQCLLGEPLTIAGDGKQIRSICYTDDLVEGLLRFITSRERGPINLGNPHEVSMLDLALYIKKAVQSDPPVRFVQHPEDDPHIRRPDIGKARANIGKTRAKLDWIPKVTFEKRMARIID